MLKVESLRHGVDGSLVLPGDVGFEPARGVWNAMIDRCPAIIVRCVSPADVSAAVRVARLHALEVGVRCGGHSVAGQSVPDGGLIRHIEVDEILMSRWRNLRYHVLREISVRIKERKPLASGDVLKHEGL